MYNTTGNAKIYPKKVMGGGVRVKSIASTDGANTYKTVYSYEDNGFSTGVTATLPPLYKDFPEWIDDYLDKDQKEKYEKILMDHDYAYGAPSPGVIYSKVSMWNVDTSGNPINGKTEFEFMTAKDHQFTATHTDGNYNLDQLKINDKSGIYGRPKATRQYELTSNGQFRLVSENLQTYDFSSSLSSRTRVVKEGNVTVSTATQPLGMISEKYMFRNKYDDDNIKIRYMTKEFENVYLFETQAKSFFYNNETDTTASGSMTTVNRNFLRDALTGQILGSAVYNTRGYADVTRVEPAYWRYTGMKDKNMLTPTALEATYKTNIGLYSAPTVLRDYAFSTDDLLAATATTWTNQFDVNNDGQAETGMWRQNDTWTYNRQIDRAGGSAYSDFANWTYTGTSYPAVDANQPWKMTSNITRYDAYAHPVEEIGIDGNYTAAIFGYENSLPVAIAQNAKLSDLKYYNYEKTATAEFKTGQGSGTYTSGQVVLDENNAIISAPTGAGPYRVTAWVKPSGESVWQYFEATLSSGQQLIVSGTSGLIDDIRIQPKGSTMSTFTYDPLTWKVTAIMDANNIATYYEYDSGGRLVKVHDQDRNMIKKYAYQYRRNN
jgi:YD repeat-containing protein